MLASGDEIDFLVGVFASEIQVFLDPASERPDW